MTPAKIQKVIDQCKNLLRTRSCTIRSLAEVIGTLVATEPGVELAPLYYKGLEREKAMALKDHRGNFEGWISLSDSAKIDLKWWTDNIQDQCRTIHKPRPSVTITADSSDYAWGGTRDPRLWEALGLKKN